MRKDLLGTKYKVDLQMAKKSFPLFSTELEQDREILLDKYQSFWGDEEKQRMETVCGESGLRMQ